jgi:hypothetical protein
VVIADLKGRFGEHATTADSMVGKRQRTMNRPFRPAG